MKLEQLAPYLPYGLKIQVDIYGQKCEIGEMYGLNQSHIELSGIRETITEEFEIELCKPILRPLSDLTNRISHNGKSFIPIKRLKTLGFPDVCFYEPLNPDLPLEIIINTEDYSQEIDLFDGWLIMQKLIEWKFDVFGLIRKGEAVDVNSLSESVY